MRERFRGFYPPTAEELEELWSSGSIILDTNALLNLYRYSSETRTDFLSVLSAVQERLWIPEQVGKEFHANRLGVIDEQRSAYNKISKALESTRKGFEAAVQKFTRHPSIETESLLRQYRDSIEPLAIELRHQEEINAPGLNHGYHDDHILKEVTLLLEGRVGRPYSATERSEVLIEASRRYQAKIPPGYEDAQKAEPEKYGDFVLWKQLLDRARLSQDPAIFITDDRKDDWWRTKDGELLGPRPELIDEYFEYSGKRIHFYSPERFLEHAKGRYNISVSEKSLGEVAQVSTESADRSKAALDLALRAISPQFSWPHDLPFKNEQASVESNWQSELRNGVYDRLWRIQKNTPSNRGSGDPGRYDAAEPAWLSKDVPSTGGLTLQELKSRLVTLFELRERLDSDFRLFDLNTPSLVVESYMETARLIDFQIETIREAIDGHNTHSGS